ncbi:hypothetical protein [Desulforhabdus amnigena]|uniref:Uncharacterized protein n=1 Tax=Desulforhabdus amnigena TaxID=40218 RepID=A0A9W6D0R2_9BACT|nr:hypothetical protein [Desulforhabdus amnigena]NLJ27966.1 hypothetical protein [Deltaproteobacteria bacterium]GLI33750.1 hypothetical protein DAMNIGENAA_11830 [Desulforhabdus amnigena]
MAAVQGVGDSLAVEAVGEVGASPASDRPVAVASPPDPLREPAVRGSEVPAACRCHSEPEHAKVDKQWVRRSAGQA